MTDKLAKYFTTLSWMLLVLSIVSIVGAFVAAVGWFFVYQGSDVNFDSAFWTWSTSITFYFNEWVNVDGGLWWIEAIGLILLIFLTAFLAFGLWSRSILNRQRIWILLLASLGCLVWPFVYGMVWNNFYKYSTPVPLIDVAFPIWELAISDLFSGGWEIYANFAFGAAIASVRFVLIALMVVTLVLALVQGWTLRFVPLRSVSKSEGNQGTGQVDTVQGESDVELATCRDADFDVPPGWYQDPDGLPCQRYWEGDTWSKRTRPLVDGKPIQEVQARRSSRALAGKFEPASRGVSGEGSHSPHVDFQSKAKRALAVSIVALLAGPLPFLWVLPIIATVYSSRVLVQARQQGVQARTMIRWSFWIAILSIAWVLVVGISRWVNA